MGKGTVTKQPPSQRRGEKLGQNPEPLEKELADIRAAGGAKSNILQMREGLLSNVIRDARHIAGVCMSEKVGDFETTIIGETAEYKVSFKRTPLRKN